MFELAGFYCIITTTVCYDAMTNHDADYSVPPTRKLWKVPLGSPGVYSLQSSP